MKVIYKYLIFFILGIILCIMFKKNLIEGNPFSFTDIFNPNTNNPSGGSDGSPDGKLYDNVHLNLVQRTRESTSDHHRLNYLTIINSDCSEIDNNYDVSGSFDPDYCIETCNSDQSCIGFQYGYLPERGSHRCKYFHDSDDSLTTKICNLGPSHTDNDGYVSSVYEDRSMWIKKNKVTQLLSLHDNQYLKIYPNHVIPYNIIRDSRNTGIAYVSLQDDNPYSISSCGDNQIANNDKTNCICTEDGHTFVGNSCVLCPEGSAGTGGTCYICPDGSQPNSEKTSCETCPTGTGAGTNGTCIQCDIGSEYAPLNDENGTLRDSCQPLPDGKYSPDGGQLLDLPNNSTVSNISPYFTCNDGYQKTIDEELCEECPQGYAGTGGTCEACGSNQIVNNERTSCQDCPVNTIPNDEKTQCICPQGYARTGETCEACGTNQIVNNERTSCQDCPVNSIPNDEKTHCICSEDGYYVVGNSCVQLSEHQQNLVDKINNDNSLNRGCSNFICDSDPNTYDHYEKRIYSSDEKPEIYDNCSNISPEEAQYHNPELNVCTKEICCENRTCLGIKEKLIETGGENFCGDRTFIPNAYVATTYGNELAINNICCSASTSEYNELFDRIIEFRNDKGGNISNGNNITGVDIRNYLYYSLLDLVAIDIANNPLETRVDRFCRDENTNPDLCADVNMKLYPIFKASGEDTVIADDCVDTGGEFNSSIKFPDYPAIGNEIAYNVKVEKKGTNCGHLGFHKVTQYPWLSDKETLNYNDYDLLSKWITGLDPSNSDDINKLILISDLEVGTNLRDIGGLDNIFNIIDSSSSIISKESIKRYIINLTKEININNTSAKTTPLDRFFHTSINNYNNSLINKNIFSGLLNQ